MADTDTARTEIDPDRLKMFSFGVFTQLSGAVTAGMIHLGDRLGLFAALAELGRPVTTAELADATGLQERWVREWAHNQAAARIIDVDTSSSPELFSLSPEAVAVLASPDHVAFGMGMFHRFPQTMGALEEMPDSFRTGLGHDYDTHGCEGAIGIEKSFEPWMRHHLLDTVLPSLDGVVQRLERGGTAIGWCGTDDGPPVPEPHVRRVRHLGASPRTSRRAPRRVRPFERPIRRPPRRTDADRWFV